MLINGAAGAVALRDGLPFSIAAITDRDGKIVELDFLADPQRLRVLELTLLDDGRQPRAALPAQQADVVSDQRAPGPGTISRSRARTGLPSLAMIWTATGA